MTSKQAPGILIAARHGERRDYIERDAGGNWIPTTSRPWDPPLSDAGHEQVRELGRRVARSLRQHNLPPVSFVYSSPLLRCCQTAAGAIVGLEEEGMTDGGRNLKIRIEHGVVESLCEKWYRSWCLPGSDGTWGYCPPQSDLVVRGGSAASAWTVDVSTINPNAKVPAPELFLSPSDMEERLKGSCGEKVQTRSDGLIDMEYTTPVAPLSESFCWGKFESRKMQLARAKNLTDKLAARHPNETILLLSHGSPVTHMFEVISGEDWTAHGVCGYASFSTYVHEKSGDGEESIVWKEPVVINDSTHVLNKDSAEYKSGH
mmetsp:Transcript_63326/g.187160  ORF Transcript_63326/g.187160 Transcript_63326/m.187160 type:complete len:317 (-) Transcript_63326:91-1041(-)